MKAIKVVSKDHIQDFLNFPEKLLINDPNYIRPLDKDIEQVFNVKKKIFFRSGECERYLFVNAIGETVGKIAIFISRKYKQQQPTGGIGFSIASMTKKPQILFSILLKLNFSKKEWKRWTGRLISGNATNFGDF